jgi:hypothetical protein
MMYVGMHRLYPILSAACGVRWCVRALPITALLFLALAAPASAAVAMDPLKPCYVSDGLDPADRETVAIHATGFTPAAHLVVTVDGAIVAQPRADAVGTVTGRVNAPFQGRGERAFTLAIQEQENPTHVISASAMVTNLSVTLRPKRARPSRKVRFGGRGFTETAPIWGHYVFGGKVRKTIRLARRPTGVCGVFHAKRRQIPVRRPAVGDWVLQVDQRRRYSPRPPIAQQVIIRVAQVVKAP